MHNTVSPMVATRSIARRKRKQRGFTLVELLVVLVILGLIATLAAPRVIKFIAGARSDTAKVQIERLSSTLELYRLEVGRYPTEDENLVALVERPADADRWAGPYLTNKDGIVDPWGRDYIYSYPGEHGDFDLYSFGADGQEGGDGEDADVRNW